MIAAIAGICSGCTSMKVDHYRAEAADLKGYKTFAWMTGKGERAIDTRVDGRFVRQILQDAVEKGLQERGLTKADKAGLQLGYHVALDDELEMRTVGQAYNYDYVPRYLYRPGTRRWVTSDVNLTTYTDVKETGTLVLDMVDAKSNKLVWRGSAQSQIDRADSSEDKEELIRAAVERILAGFPGDKE